MTKEVRALCKAVEELLAVTLPTEGRRDPEPQMNAEVQVERALQDVEFADGH